MVPSILLQTFSEAKIGLQGDVKDMEDGERRDDGVVGSDSQK